MTKEIAIMYLEMIATNATGALAESKNEKQQANIKNHIDAIDMAIDALKREKNNGWHDLIENPNDLPAEEMFFDNLLVTDGTYYMVDCNVYKEEDGTVSAESEMCIMYNVRAWKEIEPYEVLV